MPHRTLLMPFYSKIITEETIFFSFFPLKLNSSQMKYSTFSKKLVAIYLAIRHIRYILEGREFTVFTDNKPLTYTLYSKPTNIHHMKQDISNTFHNLLQTYNMRRRYCCSRTFPYFHILNKYGKFKLQDYRRGTKKKRPYFCKSRKILHEDLPILYGHSNFLCVMKNGYPRPYIPSPLHKQIFNHLHGLSHPGR